MPAEPKRELKQVPLKPFEARTTHDYDCKMQTFRENVRENYKFFQAKTTYEVDTTTPSSMLMNKSRLKQNQTGRNWLAGEVS